MAFGSFQLAGKEATAAHLKKTKKKSAVSFSSVEGEIFRGEEKNPVFFSKITLHPTALAAPAVLLCCAQVIARG